MGQNIGVIGELHSVEDVFSLGGKLVATGSVTGIPPEAMIAFTNVRF